MGIDYEEMTNRNIGFISPEQQNKLRDSCVCILGLGGLGGIAAETLARAGIGKFRIIDQECFDSSNRNRQIFAFSSTIGKRKIDVTENFLKDINPDVEIKKFESINEENAEEVFNNVNVTILALDDPKAYLFASRETRKRQIPLVESWAAPFGIVRVFTKDTISLEEAYRFSTIGREIKELSEEELKQIHKKALISLTKIEGVIGFFQRSTLLEMLSGGSAKTFAPAVSLSGLLIATETIKILTGIGKISLAPKWSVYNPFDNKIPEQI